jgi:hypothetical protein
MSDEKISINLSTLCVRGTIIHLQLDTAHRPPDFDPARPISAMGRMELEAELLAWRAFWATIKA